MIGKSVRSIAGFPVRNSRSQVVIRYIRRRQRQGRQTAVLFANANAIIRCAHLRDKIREAQDILLLNDGIGMDVASCLLYGRPFGENLNGTDFTPRLLSCLAAGTRVFLFGAQPCSVEGAAHMLPAKTGCHVIDFVDGYSTVGQDERLTARINEAQTEVLLVGLGNPLQEEWILRNRTHLNAPIVMGIGALFDFLSGQVPRAPERWRRLRLEWLYRLGREPRRLGRRYTLDMVRFLLSLRRSPIQAVPPIPAAHTEDVAAIPRPDPDSMRSTGRL